ncbi:MAG: phosphatase PAP2 family protein [Candidatus Methylomirabilia bacterium]
MATRWRALFLAGGGVFVTLALAVSAGGIFPLERGLYEWIVGATSPGVVAAFEWINQLGDWRFLLPLALLPAVLLIFVLPPTLRQRWWLWAGVMLSVPILEGIAKEIVGRPRPETAALGFPSGHVTAATAFFVMAAHFLEKLFASSQARTVIWILAALPILLVAIARVVLRAHWPLDTLGGFALGLTCAAAAIWWSERRS